MDDTTFIYHRVEQEYDEKNEQRFLQFMENFRYYHFEAYFLTQTENNFEKQQSQDI